MNGLFIDRSTYLLAYNQHAMKMVKVRPRPQCQQEAYGILHMLMALTSTKSSDNTHLVGK